MQINAVNGIGTRIAIPTTNPYKKVSLGNSYFPYEAGEKYIASIITIVCKKKESGKKEEYV